MVDEKAGDLFLFRAFRRPLLFLFAGGDKDDEEIGDVAVGNKMLGAVDLPAVAGALGAALHAADVGARLGFGHCERVLFFAAHRGQQVAFALLALAGEEDVRGPPPEDTESHRGAAELAFEQGEGQLVESATADFFGHVGGVKNPDR